MSTSSRYVSPDRYWRRRMPSRTKPRCSYTAIARSLSGNTPRVTLRMPFLARPGLGRLDQHRADPDVAPVAGDRDRQHADVFGRPPRSTLTRTLPTTLPSASATSTSAARPRIISPIQNASDGSLTAPGVVISQRPSRRTSPNRRARPRPSVGRPGRSVQRRPSRRRPRLAAASHDHLCFSGRTTNPAVAWTKGLTSSRYHLSLTDKGWWGWGDSNPRPPACPAGALPAELQPHASPVHSSALYRSPPGPTLRRAARRASSALLVRRLPPSRLAENEARRVLLPRQHFDSG